MNESNKNQIGALSPATKADVREIVTEVVTTLIPSIVTPIVETIVSREIDKLAGMVKRGFDEVYERLASKEDVNELRADLNGFRREMGIITDKNESRFDDHEERISYLEGVSA